MTGEPGNLLDGDAARGHDAHEGVPQLPGNPVVAQARGPGDLAEAAPDVVLVEHGADRRAEHQSGVVPQLASLQAVRGPCRLALAEGVHGDLRQLERAP